MAVACSIWWTYQCQVGSSSYCQLCFPGRGDGSGVHNHTAMLAVFSWKWGWIWCAQCMFFKSFSADDGACTYCGMNTFHEASRCPTGRHILYIFPFEKRTEKTNGIIQNITWELLVARKPRVSSSSWSCYSGGKEAKGECQLMKLL